MALNHCKSCTIIGYLLQGQGGEDREGDDNEEENKVRLAVGTIRVTAFATTCLSAIRNVTIVTTIFSSCYEWQCYSHSITGTTTRATSVTIATIATNTASASSILTMTTGTLNLTNLKS